MQFIREARLGAHLESNPLNAKGRCTPEPELTRNEKRLPVWAAFRKQLGLHTGASCFCLQLVGEHINFAEVFLGVDKAEPASLAGEIP
jgi:hypothetical protein